MTIGERLAAARKVAGYDTQAALGEALGLSQTTVSDVENDRNDDIGVRRLLRFAAKVRVPLEDLVVGLDGDYDMMRRDLLRQRFGETGTSTQGASHDAEHEAASRLLEIVHADHAALTAAITRHARAILDMVEPDNGRETIENRSNAPRTGSGDR